MEDRVKKAFNMSNFGQVINVQKKNIDLYLENSLIASYENNVFKITEELIGFLHALDCREITICVIKDIYSSPVEVSIKDFLKHVIEIYQKAMQKYKEGHEKLQKAREIRKVIEWEQEDS